MTAFAQFTDGLRAIITNTVNAFFRFSHNGFALIGLAMAFTGITLATQPELRQGLELRVTAWLQERQYDLLGMEARPDAVERATALDPKELPKQQASVAYWLSQKYRVAPEPLGALVAEAYQIGVKVKVEPTLLLAIMAIESGFNPFAQSPVGAQGLMQVMTRVHSDKYDNFGGVHAAFDPVTNLRVGAKVLQDCIARAGSVEGGLRQYVGATTNGDGGYVVKVMSEFGRLQSVAAGKSVPIAAPQQVAVAAPTAPAAAPAAEATDPALASDAKPTPVAPVRPAVGPRSKPVAVKAQPKTPPLATPDATVAAS